MVSANLKKTPTNAVTHGEHVLCETMPDFLKAVPSRDRLNGIPGC